MSSSSDNPKRSVASRHNLYAAIEEVLAVYPDLRVGQLLSNSTMEGDLFNIENDQLADSIRFFLKDSVGRKLDQLNKK